MKYLTLLPSVDPAAQENAAIVKAAQKETWKLSSILQAFQMLTDYFAQSGLALREAASTGHLKLVKYLTGLPRNYFLTALCNAAKAGSLEVVQHLLVQPY